MTHDISTLRAAQTKWEDEFRAGNPEHPILTLIDGVVSMPAPDVRKVEQMYGEQWPLASKARTLAHIAAGKNFSGIVTMAMNAALRAVPDSWETVEVFRFGAAVDSAMWAILARASLKDAEYAALTRAVGSVLPLNPPTTTEARKVTNETTAVAEATTTDETVEAKLDDTANVPTEEPVVTTVSVATKSDVSASETVPSGGEHAVAAQQWVDANRELYKEFVKSKMGYAGGAFSYTCEKAIKEAGLTVGRGERTLVAFAILAKAAVEQSERLAKIKIASAWWSGRSVSTP